MYPELMLKLRLILVQSWSHSYLWCIHCGSSGTGLLPKSMFDANYNHSRMAHKPKVNFRMSASWMSHKPMVNFWMSARWMSQLHNTGVNSKNSMAWWATVNVDWAWLQARAEWTTSGVHGVLAWDHCSRKQITGILDSIACVLLSSKMYGPSDHLCNTSAVLADSGRMRSAGQSGQSGQSAPAPWCKKHVHYTNGPWAKRLHATV